MSKARKARKKSKCTESFSIVTFRRAAERKITKLKNFQRECKNLED